MLHFLNTKIDSRIDIIFLGERKDFIEFLHHIRIFINWISNIILFPVPNIMLHDLGFRYLLSFLYEQLTKDIFENCLSCVGQFKVVKENI